MRYRSLGYSHEGSTWAGWGGGGNLLFILPGEGGITPYTPRDPHRRGEHRTRTSCGMSSGEPKPLGSTLCATQHLAMQRGER